MLTWLRFNLWKYIEEQCWKLHGKNLNMGMNCRKNCIAVSPHVTSTLGGFEIDLSVNDMRGKGDLLLSSFIWSVAGKGRRQCYALPATGDTEVWGY